MIKNHLDTKHPVVVILSCRHSDTIYNTNQTLVGRIWSAWLQLLITYWVNSSIGFSTENCEKKEIHA